MHLPKLVTSADLAKLAAPGETKMVRVLLRRIVHTGPHRVSGSKRKYLFERNAAVGAHVLDVPESVWMHGSPVKTYVDNLSISHDLQGNRIPTKAPLVIQILDWPGAAAKQPAEAPEAKSETPAADPHGAMQRLAEFLGAPPVIMSALEILESNLPADEKEAALNDTLETLKQQEAVTTAKVQELGIPSPVDQSSHSASPPSEKKTMTNAERQRALRARRKAEKEAAKAKLQTADA